ncbi:MAG: polyprenyl synthetase family protein, partial [Candidatus Poseidoniia archaeon]
MVTLRNAKRHLSRRRDVIDEALENLVQDRLTGTDAPAMNLASDILLAGGKRYRPILTLLAFEAAGGEDESEVLDLALAAELIHTATLVHDDIYDQSKTRRGKPTLHSTHGVSHGII